ncbi:MAG: NIPSNAP family protein [Mesorhizobium sp.]|uniref:NIPSNAP family protein n=1 Tax=unclassified Mesorhizobium TaxID=325217 RepID=UPI000FCBE01E|nr:MULTISPECIES: NIPSNAP family protein [unclassified Mesorhizobium]RUV70941.1 NIPSNAP family protein [Mesorhizobium sp. M5C.F.Cr.IN.023.01.1.1]RWF85247.1 MAG: NIPSNAP family protein [Mesorhizobium sp.]RWF96404.1 MAG: NIPSNAP family protein [Mesorhizobium sp.]RWI32947.1 MAG: NIPSNAP family protein [Mesorhizobium sp.]RWI45756.1 MAG: NIPSNAP family protein [Mesorhizobium sp.]
MSLPPNAPSKSSLNASPVVELRQYTLKPGRRETLIDIFDGHLIEGQEAAGMTIIGQFRDLDRPDMFVWLRGFDGMEARKNALTAFYEGPVWAAYRDAANATMISSDDVLLLKPAWPGAGFELTGSQRTTLPGYEKPREDNRLSDIVVIKIHHLRPGAGADFASRFETDAIPTLAEFGARPLAAFVTEHAENSFPRLPVRSGENVFISVAAFDSADAHESVEAALAAAPAWQALLSRLARPTETLRLSATSRSLLGR